MNESIDNIWYKKTRPLNNNAALFRKHFIQSINKEVAPHLFFHKNAIKAIANPELLSKYKIDKWKTEWRRIKEIRIRLTKPKMSDRDLQLAKDIFNF